MGNIVRTSNTGDRNAVSRLYKKIRRIPRRRTRTAIFLLNDPRQEQAVTATGDSGLTLQDGVALGVIARAGVAS